MKWVNTISELFAQTKMAPTKIVQAIEDRQVDLVVTMQCSNLCPYCVNHLYNTEYQKWPTIIDEMGIEAYLDRIIALFQPYAPLKICLAGAGEPTEHKHFKRMLERLYPICKSLIMQTNLNGSQVLVDFCKQYPKEEIHSKIILIPSYHLGAFLDDEKHGIERRKRFLDVSFPQAVESGACIKTLITPMTPKCLWDPEFVNDVKRLQTLNPFGMQVQPLLGPYPNPDSPLYPDAYTETERLQFIKISEQLNYDMFTRGVIREKDELLSKQYPEQLHYLNPTLEIGGYPCLIPSNRIQVSYKGDMRWCQGDPEIPLGNIRDSILRPLFFDKPVPCPSKNCLCTSFGNVYCLKPNGITMQEYYYAQYMQRGQPAIAKLFQHD